MRHKNITRRLSRNYGKRRALLRELSKHLIMHERIITTRAKAKEAQKVVEKLIHISKTDTVANRRRIFALLRDVTSTDKIFEDIAKRFADRSSGFTRVLNYVHRKGDAAPQAILELVIIKEKEIKPKKVKEVKEAKPSEKPEEKTHQKPAEEKTHKEHKEKEAPKEKARPSTPKPAAPKKAHKEKAPSARPEEKKQKSSLMDRFKNLFKKDTPKGQ